MALISATDDNVIACSPCVAGAQGRLAVHASWRCIAKGGCGCVACPAVDNICLQVCLAAIACNPITVSKPAREGTNVCHAYGASIPSNCCASNKVLWW
jgi:hypothetical protein